MSEIRFIYFDLDDTLLDHRHAEKQALADLCAQFSEVFGHLPVHTVQDTYHQHNVVLWSRYARGEISREDLQRLRFEQVLEVLMLEGAGPADLNEFYLNSYSNYWNFSPGARETFHKIADQFRVGVLTNGFSYTQHEKLARFPDVSSRLDALMISDEVGYMKPDPRLFACAADAVGEPPETILYIGDSFESDVKGALEAGWKSAWYVSKNSENGVIEGVFRFSDWKELLEHLGL